MNNIIIADTIKNALLNSAILEFKTPIVPNRISGNRPSLGHSKKEKPLPEILFITSFPPRECGIATYSQDLMKALNHKFRDSFSLKVCALETGHEKHKYTEGVVKYTLDPSKRHAFQDLAEAINYDNRIEIVLIQHEFGFYHNHEADFSRFLNDITKPIIMVFHTVLPNPDDLFKTNVKSIVESCESIIVMTNTSANILINEYHIPESKITVIPHGTHLVPHLDKAVLKGKYHLTGRKVFSTFGLLGEGKCIETTLEAMPAIIKVHPDALFLVIGKTHPNIIKENGEKYRQKLQGRVQELGLQNNVQFINKYLPLPELLEYLQLTDIYLFTSKDPNQAVSGTFSYALSCGCPIISTPIPHAREVLSDEAGIIIDFEDSKQMSEAVNRLLADDILRGCMSANGIKKMVSSAWENTALAHALLFDKYTRKSMSLKFSHPAIKLDHVKRMTTDFGMIQFSKINQPDIESGYTIDDNARAMISVCQHYELTRDEADLPYITTYLNFIKYCQQAPQPPLGNLYGAKPPVGIGGNFLNYVDVDKHFTAQNYETNLEDANGRTMWALGFLMSKSDILPKTLIAEANQILQKALPYIMTMHSSRAMAFAIKGLHFANEWLESSKISLCVTTLANRLVEMYKHEAEEDWVWFEGYLTYGNSILPEAILCAYQETGDKTYMEIAKSSFDFLLSIIFQDDKIKVVSNQGWHIKGQVANQFGEQAIDVAYTILALSRFYDVFKDPSYLNKMETAFDWFLGKNHLKQTIYNPCTGGCYDGLEEHYVNLNQGAESTVSYLMSRLTVEKYNVHPLKTKNVLAWQVSKA